MVPKSMNFGQRKKILLKEKFKFIIGYWPGVATEDIAEN